MASRHSTISLYFFDKSAAIQNDRYKHAAIITCALPCNIQTILFPFQFSFSFTGVGFRPFRLKVTKPLDDRTTNSAGTCENKGLAKNGAQA
jgi:hypothetical protein